MSLKEEKSMQNLQNAIRHNTIIMLSAETRNKSTSYRSISYHTSARIKYKTWTNSQIKNQKRVMNSD